MTRTHTRRHDQHEVARANSSVRPSIAHERRTLVQRKIVGRSSVQILRKFANDRHFARHVVVRDLLALTNSQRRSDGLSKLQDKLARGNVSYGEAMTRRNRAA